MASLFEESLVQFRTFLSDQGYSDNILWVTAEDVLLSRKRLIYFKESVFLTNDTALRRLFDSAISEAKEILLAALCEFDDKTLCYAWVPADEAEAEYRLMPKGVKMSVPVNGGRLKAKLVRSQLKWRYLRVKYRRQQLFKDWLFS